MRPLCLAGLLVFSLAAAPPRARPRTVLVVPFATQGGAPEWAGLALAEILTDAVVQQDRDNFLTLQQLHEVLLRRDLPLTDPAVPRRAAEWGRVLGATDVVQGSVELRGRSLVLEARRLSAGGGHGQQEARLEGPFEDLPRLAQRLSVQLLGTPEAQSPMTSDLEALEQMMRCELSLAPQPLGPRHRPVLDNERLHAADESCGAALDADPGLGLAHAGLAVALAAARDLGEAEEENARAQQGRFVPSAVLAGAWIATRRGAPDRARAMLQAAFLRHAGFLQAAALLADDRAEAGDAAGALSLWNQVLARAPGLPWAMAGKARALSRLGRRGAALAMARAALERDPGDPELMIELAARALDLGRGSQAEEQLQLALAADPPRPLAALRLGSLFLRKRRWAEAGESLHKALRLAVREDEGPLRAATHAELARLAEEQGRQEEALAERRLARAEAEGEGAEDEAAAAGLR